MQKLHIPYKSKIKASSPLKIPKIKKIQYKKISISQKINKNIKIINSIETQRKPIKKRKNIIWELSKLSLIIAITFISLTVLASAPSFIKVLYAKIDKSGSKQKEIALENVINNKHVAPILPTAGMEIVEKKEIPNLAINISPLKNRIIIPKIGKNVPIVEISKKNLEEENWQKLEDDIQEGLRNGVVHYPSTAKPGQIGNVFITGHSSYYFWDEGKYKDVFALLHDLKVNDEFVLYWDQKKYFYKINERKVVAPKDTSVLQQPGDKKIATLMTCTPIGTTLNRLILVAEQIE